MKKRINKRIIYSVFYSLIIISSSIIAPILVISNKQKTNLKIQKNFEFSKGEDIRTAFKKAKISPELIESYIKSVNEIQNSNSVMEFNNFLENVSNVQSDISMRRIKNNYSVEKLSVDINYVKDILNNDSSTYLSYFSEDTSNFDYIKALYAKRNLISWSNLNNVLKYDLIYEYLNTVENSIENFYKLRYLKELINSKEIKERENQITNNNKKIEELNESINSNEQEIKRVQNEIAIIQNNFISNDDFFEDINEKWLKVREYYIETTTLASVAAVASVLAVIPIFGVASLIAGTAAALGASAFGYVLDLAITDLKEAIGINVNEIWENYKTLGSFCIKIGLAIYKFATFMEKLNIRIAAQITKSLFKLTSNISGITLITALAQIALSTYSYIDIRNKKDEYISSTKNEFNTNLQSAIVENNLEVKKISGSAFKKTSEIIEYTQKNKIMYEEKEKFYNSNEILNNDFKILSNSLKEFPMMSSQKLELIKMETEENFVNLDNCGLEDLYPLLDKMIIESNKLKEERNLKRIYFDRHYNYDDKDYWNGYFSNLIEPTFNNVEVLFI